MIKDEGLSFQTQLKIELSPPNDGSINVWKNPCYNPDQIILNKIEKSSKTGQDKKSSISTLVCFLTAIVKV